MSDHALGNDDRVWGCRVDDAGRLGVAIAGIAPLADHHMHIQSARAARRFRVCAQGGGSFFRLTAGGSWRRTRRGRSGRDRPRECLDCKAGGGVQSVTRWKGCFPSWPNSVRPIAETRGRRAEVVRGIDGGCRRLLADKNIINQCFIEEFWIPPPLPSMGPEVSRCFQILPGN